jgi:hypothetical protein
LDGELVSLASSAAATVVTLLATDAWTQVRTEVGMLWRRLRPGLDGQAAEATAAVTRDRAEIAGAPAGHGAGQALRAEWEARFLRLVGADAAAAAEFARMARGLDGLRREQEVSVRQDATASGHGIVVQAGRDARIGHMTTGHGE